MMETLVITKENGHRIEINDATISEKSFATLSDYDRECARYAMMQVSPARMRVGLRTRVGAQARIGKHTTQAVSNRIIGFWYGVN